MLIMITPLALARFTLDLGKATFDNAFTSLATIQTFSEDAVTGLADRTTWLPAPLKAIVHECVGLLRRTRGDLKDTVDRCYRLFGELTDDGPVTRGAAAADQPLEFARHSAAGSRGR